MNTIEQIYSHSNSIKDYSRLYMQYLSSVLNNISLNEIESFADLLLKARDRGLTIFFIGNGGSAAMASHFANDISIGTRTYEKPFRVISLCDNQAVITAIANDDDYEKNI
jgi:D-sedoheptulose 7-phosphate isomerase